MSVPKRFGAINLPRFKSDGTAKTWNYPPEFNGNPEVSLIWLKSQILRPLFEGDPPNTDNLRYEGLKAPVTNAPLRIPSVIQTGGIGTEHEEAFINAIQENCDTRGTLVCNRVTFGGDGWAGPITRGTPDYFAEQPVNQWVGGEFLCVLDMRGLMSEVFVATNTVTYNPGSLAECQARFGVGAVTDVPAPVATSGPVEYNAGTTWSPAEDGPTILAKMVSQVPRFKRILFVFRSFETPVDVFAGIAGISCRLSGPGQALAVAVTTTGVVGNTQSSITNMLSAANALYAPLGVSFQSVNVDLSLANPYEDLADICNNWLGEGIEEDM